MSTATGNYFGTLAAETGNCWNRFWFTPTDRRPLDALRAVVGAISFYMLATLTPDLGAYFADGGLLPTETVQNLEREFHSFSYLNLLHTPTELLVAHLAGMAIVALFTFGIFTSLTSVLSLAVMLSTVHRAPMLTTLVEPVLTTAMFYICLGPAGPLAWLTKKFTDRPIAQESAWATVALRLFQIHIAMLYATLGLSKLLGDTWWNGTGVWWLVARRGSTLFDLTGLATLTAGETPIGVYLLNVWSHAIVVFEIAFAIFIWNRRLRPLLLGWSVIHWIGIAILLGQLPLAATMVGVNVAYLSGETLCRRKQLAAVALASDSR